MQKFIIINFLIAATLLGFRAQPGRASEIDKKTIITISGPVQIPGAVLQPGTYMVKRADPNLPNVIRFLNEDGTHVYATVRTIPVERNTPSSKVEVTMAETKGAKPMALSVWFYPGDLTGQQFLYPRGGDVLMAMSNTEVQGLAPAPSKEPEAQPKAPEGQPISTNFESTPAASEENVEVAQSTYPSSQSATSVEPAAATAQEVAQQTPASREPATLPQTASLLPLLALFGAGAFAGGTGLKAALQKPATNR